VAVTRVFLVGCGKSKVSKTVAARELYIGSLFKAARSYVESTRSPWFILSAKYGLVHPDKRTSPYEFQLKTKSQRDDFGLLVFAQIVSHVLPGAGSVKFVVLAGEMYANPVCRKLEENGFQCEQPLRGLELGYRLRWFKEHTKGKK
jgi:hypothetical protein